MTQVKFICREWGAKDIIRFALLSVITALLLYRFFPLASGIFLFLNLLDLGFRLAIFVNLNLSKLRLLRLGMFLLTYSKVFSIFVFPQSKLIESLITLIGVALASVNVVCFMTDDLNKQILEVATCDSLTGLMNRHSFFHTARKVLKDLGKKNLTAALIYLDLNKFKLINDEHGHQMGDKVLQIIGTRFKGVVKQSDLVGRLGGDEFAILVQNVTREQASQVVQRLLNSISSPIIVDNLVFKVTLSAGIAMFPENGTSLDELLYKADKEMYAAKQSLSVENLLPEND